MRRPAPPIADILPTLSHRMPQSFTTILKRLGPAGLLGLLWTAVPMTTGILLLANLGILSQWLLAHPGIGLAIYIVVFIVTAGLGLLPTYSQSALAGWVFGAAIGIPAALIGFLGASMIGYAIARRVSRDRIEQLINEHPRAHAVRAGLLERGFARSLLIVSLIRMPPNSPFALTNLILAGAGTNRLAYALGTLIGMTPRTSLVIILAATAASSGAPDLQTFLKERGLLLPAISIVATFIVLGIIGRMANQAIDRMTATSGTPGSPGPPAAPPAPEHTA